jgi:hypothetical protein
MYLHKAFGLIIESPFPLPAETLFELAPGQKIDLSIVCQEYLYTRRLSHSPECSISGSAADFVMRWEEVGEFRLCHGQELTIRPRPGVSEDVLSLFVTGSVFAMLLHQRGMTTLHGSVVEVEGQAVAFLAPKGTGKSTLALALQRCGATLLSDDIVALYGGGNLLHVASGFSQARLWPDALAQLGHDFEDYAKLRAEVDKRAVPLPFKEQEVPPLRHIMLIANGEELRMERLNSHDALLALLPHWYPTRFGTYTLRQLQATSQQFLQCLEIAQKVGVSVLQRPRSLAEIGKVAEAVCAYVLAERASLAPANLATSILEHPSIEHLAQNKSHNHQNAPLS